MCIAPYYATVRGHKALLHDGGPSVSAEADLVYLVDRIFTHPFHGSRIGADEMLVDGASDLLSGGQIHDLDGAGIRRPPKPLPFESVRHSRWWDPSGFGSGHLPGRN